MIYKCGTCGRLEESNDGPPKCSCDLPFGITLMKPVFEDKKENLNEYLAE